MIRLTALYLAIGFLCVYAWRDWYKALCGVIALMAVIQHPDMPKTLLGIQGLNPWNVALLSVLMAWFVNRNAEHLKWDMPPAVTGVLLLYLGFVLVGVARMLGDTRFLPPDETTTSLISEQLINTLKWVIPGLLLFHGCRSRERLRFAAASLLAIYALLAVQVLRWMAPHATQGGEVLADMALRMLPREVGYHRVNLSTMLAGASWALLAGRRLFPAGSRWTLLFWGMAGLAVAAQALTAGRTGYAAWAAIGIFFAALRWRKLLVLLPIAVIVVITYFPGVAERMQEGFTEDSVDSSPGDAVTADQVVTIGDGQADLYTVTAGRTLVWPFVVDQIAEKPYFGYGRLGMMRSGLTYELYQRFGASEAMGHPHNAYLEWLLDNGWIGFAIIMPFYVYLMWTGVVLLRDHRSPVFEAAGGMLCALVGALLLGALGSQSFYPREGAVGMWCAIGLGLRVAVERRHALRRLAPVRRRPVAGKVPPKAAPVPPPPVDSLLWPKAS
jgi:O-antigen ligase